MRRWRRPLLKITLGMLVGACVGWAISPATRYKITAIFRADPPPRAYTMKVVPDDYEKDYQSVAAAAFTTLRSPDLPDIAIQQRGTCPASSIQSGAQLHDHLEISLVPDTHLIRVAVEDLSRVGADQTLEAYLGAARARIALSGPPELAEGRSRIRTSDYRQQIFASIGAASGAVATIFVLLLKSRRHSSTALPPLQSAAPS
jgi:hypothetical protein